VLLIDFLGINQPPRLAAKRYKQAGTFVFQRQFRD
jgi:hypothetical protein